MTGILAGMAAAGLALFSFLLVRSALNALSLMAVSRLAEEEDLPLVEGVRHYLRRRLAYLLTLQFGILTSGVALTLLAAALLARLGSPHPLLWGFAWCAAGLPALAVVAQVIASLSPHKVLLYTLPLVRGALLLFGVLTLPLDAVLSRRIDAAKERLGEGEDDKEEEISALIQVGQSEGILESDDSELIRGVLQFGDTVAREVMTPRTDMVCAPSDTPLRLAAEILAKARHTRLPLYEGQIDNVVGAAYLKDFLAPLLAGEGDRPVSAYARPVPFVPENKPISDLLREFQAGKLQLAIVVDEYGGVDGLVTTEDLIEEIVGEIQESAESEEEPFHEAAPGTLVALGRASVYDLAARLDADLPEGDYDSVAGWISTRLGAIPHTGQRLAFDGLEVEILSADRRRIHKVKVSRAPAASKDDGAPGSG
ncbi:MAG: hemolysin family protein [Acidobacteriota bacterium]